MPALPSLFYTRRCLVAYVETHEGENKDGATANHDVLLLLASAAAAARLDKALGAGRAHVHGGFLGAV